MTHAEMEELYELYVLGALEFEVAREIDSHVADDCTHCLQQIHRAVYTTAALSEMTDPVTPPSVVRERLLASISASAPSRSRLRWAFPALAAASLALLGVALYSYEELNAERARLDRVAGERDQLRAAVSILSRSETRTVQFGKTDNTAHGRVLVNPKGGFVIVGSELPEIAADRTFELWLVPAKGAPVPAGLFEAKGGEGFVHVSEQSVDPAQIAAIAVSVEPKAGSLAPTTKPFLIVPLG